MMMMMMMMILQKTMQLMKTQMMLQHRCLLVQQLREYHGSWLGSGLSIIRWRQLRSSLKIREPDGLVLPEVEAQCVFTTSVTSDQGEEPRLMPKPCLAMKPSNGKSAFGRKYLDNPSEEHWRALTCLMGYAKGTIGRRLKLRTPKELRVYAFVDSNYATNTDNRRSVTGFPVSVGGTVVADFSKNII
jgi:hypothetical protein